MTGTAVGRAAGPDPGRRPRESASTLELAHRESVEECRVRRRLMHRFARHELEALTRRARHRLQRWKASGIFGNLEHRTLWDEFRHNRHTGPHPVLEAAFDEVVDGVILDLAGTVPAHVSVLLCEYVHWTQDSNGEEPLGDGVDVSLIASHLRGLVNGAALN